MFFIDDGGGDVCTGSTLCCPMIDTPHSTQLSQRMANGGVIAFTTVAKERLKASEA
jgi:hypothetical protein